MINVTTSDHSSLSVQAHPESDLVTLSIAERHPYGSPFREGAGMHTHLTIHQAVHLQACISQCLRKLGIKQ